MGILTKRDYWPAGQALPRPFGPTHEPLPSGDGVNRTDRMRQYRRRKPVQRQEFPRGPVIGQKSIKTPMDWR